MSSNTQSNKATAVEKSTTITRPQLEENYNQCTGTNYNHILHDGSLPWATKLRIPTTTTKSRNIQHGGYRLASLDMEQLHHKKHNFGHNSVETYTTYWSAFVQDKQQYCADSTVHKHKAWRPGGNYTTGSPYQSVHAV